MKKIVFLLTGIFMLQCYVLNAAHIIGGEISYYCYGEGNYQLIIKLYRDCYGGGAGFDSNSPDDAVGQITIYRGNDSNPYRSILLDKPKIVNINPDLGDGCIAVPPDICVEEGVYSFPLRLPVGDESYHISYQRCCRNNTISNIYDPGGTGATYTVEITPESQESCNNSPEFKGFPPVAICANEPLYFDHGARDQEGDSLVYEFCSPLKGGTVDDVAPDPDASPPYENVDFIEPRYSITTPLSGDPIVSIDSQTGIITGTPVNTGQFVVGICVKEYRAGVLLSTIQRDFQFNVVNCNVEVIADLDGVTKDGRQYLYELCEGETLSMINESYYAENIQRYQWRLDLEEREELSTRDVSIPDMAEGNYNGLMVVNPGSSCTDTAFVNISVYRNPTPKWVYSYDTCLAGPVVFMSFVEYSTFPIQNYRWDFGDETSQVDQFVEHQYQSRDFYDVQLTAEDEFGCRGTYSETIEWNPPPDITFNPPMLTEDCIPLSVNFNLFENDLDSIYDVSWEFSDGYSVETPSVTHTFTEPGRYDIELNILSKHGCEISERYSEWIIAEEPAKAAFHYLPKGGINKKDEIHFVNLSERAVKWNWTFGNGHSSTASDPKYAYQEAGSWEVGLMVEDQYGCQDSTTQQLEVRSVYRIYVPNAFSPNADDVNDAFRAYVFCPLEDFEMKIYDRWGQQVFESQDVELGWDGLKKGEAFEPGVYVWVISFLADGDKQVLSGDVTLVE